MSVQEIRVAGRNTQGVRLIKLSDSDEISSVTRIEKDELEEEEGLIADNTTETPESTETTE